MQARFSTPVGFAMGERLLGLVANRKQERHGATLWRLRHGLGRSAGAAKGQSKRMAKLSPYKAVWNAAPKRTNPRWTAMLNNEIGRLVCAFLGVHGIRQSGSQVQRRHEHMIIDHVTHDSPRAICGGMRCGHAAAAVRWGLEVRLHFVKYKSVHGLRKILS